VSKKKTDVMDPAEFKEAFEWPWPAPSPSVLKRRFLHALERSGGDVHSGMAAVNELLELPITYDVLVQLLGNAA
jgi:hypothetical protein